jgi:NhaP-type Na+/H+ and K+/H+ antiporter
MASSFARTMLIYGIALVGSSFTYHLFDYKLGLPYPLPWLCTGMLWGVFNFFSLGWFAMRQTEIT